LQRVDGAVVIGGVASCRSAFVYDEVARRLLLALKYRNRRDALAFLASEVAALVDVDAEVLTWVPTTAARRRARGFDQAELLARAVGRRVGLPVRPLLCRVDDRPQTGRSGTARHEGPRFVALPCRRIAAAVVVIDDIGTTGATLQSAARALGAAGTAAVHARTAAWTPRRDRAERGRERN
jgi:predicted amidophosphoribosyltransferase